MEYFGIQPVFSDRKIKGKELAVFKKLGWATAADSSAPGFSFPPALLPQAYQGVKIKKTITEPRIFISRKVSRGIINETQIELFLAGHGFKKFYLKDLSIEDQLSLLTHAEYIIAADGAELSPLTLNPGPKGIIEIDSPNWHTEFHTQILSAKTGRYIKILTELDWEKILVPFHCSFSRRSLFFELDIALLEKAVDALLS